MSAALHIAAVVALGALALCSVWRRAVVLFVASYSQVEPALPPRERLRLATEALVALVAAGVAVATL